MTYWKKISMTVAAMAALGLVLPAARAQQDTGAPKPAAREYPPILPGQIDPDPGAPQPADVLPDTRPLTGAQEFSIGTVPARHSYWAPGFRFANFWGSNPAGATRAGQWVSTSYFVGTLSLRKNWIRSSLAMNYSGGGSFSTAESASELTGSFHQLGLVQQFDWQRWKLSLIDQFSYSTSTSFGFGGGTNIDLPGIGGALGGNLPGLQNNYVPVQSIFGSIGPRYSNGGVAQVEYLLTKRSSLVVSGSYGILRFTEPKNIDVNNTIFSGGYNYQISGKDYIGVVYHFSDYRYLGSPQALADHSAQFAYGRKLTGRIGLQLFGGPEITVFRRPIVNETQRIGGAGGAALAYSLSRGQIGINYSHGLTGGSGLLVGSTSDQVQLQGSRQLSRRYTGQFGFGYARNKSLESSKSIIPGQTFNGYFTNVGLNHPMGRNANLNVGYTLQKQTADATFCVTAACGTSYTQHRISIGFDWHTRPYVIE